MRRALLAVAVMMTGLFVAAPAAAGGGCHQPAATEGTGDTVEIKNMCFEPTILRVEPGTEVRFVNDESPDHNVSGVGLPWAELPTGASAGHRFDAPGIYPYMCNLHPGMTGAVVVGGAAPVLAGSSEPVPDDAGGVATALVVVIAVLAAGAGVTMGRLSSRRASDQLP